VKIVKVTTNPVSIPNGRIRPCPTLPESTIGSTGRIHGDRIVITPDTKANASRITMSSASSPVQIPFSAARRRYRSQIFYDRI
jgi:hypothetical protein